MKNYILIIRNKNDNNIFIECKDMKDVENRLFEYCKKAIDFDVYKIIDMNEVVELTDLCFKRLINHLK